MKGLNTKMLHGYPVIDGYTGAASIPKYQTSTFDQKSCYVDGKKYSYSRFGNPTVMALESAVSKLEGAKHALVFSSGMAAISNVLMLAGAGGHVIFPSEVYGGTFQFATEVMPRLNMEVSFLDYDNLELVESTIKENTKILYIETPSNPLLKVTDIRKLVEIAKRHKLITVADNTFMTPFYQRPLELGVDIVVESMTKFINGHSDVVAGMIATNSDEYIGCLGLFQKNFGAIMGVEDAWLVLRGMKTMGLRMEKSVSNAAAISEFLAKQLKIKTVYYPGIPSCRYYKIQMSQATSGGAVLSFKFHNKEDMDKFVERIKIPIYAVSLGGVESIISHPATMSHKCMSKEDRLKYGVTDEILRLSCGIEDIEDLIEDLEQALAD